MSAGALKEQLDDMIEEKIGHAEGLQVGVATTCKQAHHAWRTRTRYANMKRRQEWRASRCTPTGYQDIVAMQRDVKIMLSRLKQARSTRTLPWHVQGFKPLS